MIVFALTGKTALCRSCLSICANHFKFRSFHSGERSIFSTATSELLPVTILLIGYIK